MGQKKQDHGTMCTLCRALPLSTPRTQAHVNLHPHTHTQAFGAAGQQRLYSCSICNTFWLYQRDRWGACLGFKLWPGSLEGKQIEDGPAPAPRRADKTKKLVSQ